MIKDIYVEEKLFKEDTNITIENIESPFKINYCNSYNYIGKWLLDKVKVNAEYDEEGKKTKNPNRVTKLEIYNYFDRKDIDSMLVYLKSKKFKYTTDTFKYNRIFHPLLKLQGKYITGQGKVIDQKHLMNYKRYYYVDFVRVLIHRNRTYLLKAYYNIKENKSFFKLELTYVYNNRKYRKHFLDWLNASKGMNEILKKIENKFQPIGYDEDFSKQITYDSFIFQMLSRFGKSNVNHINNIFSKLTGLKYRLNGTE